MGICDTITINRKKAVLSINSILYIVMRGKIAEIHISGGEVYKTHMTLGELEEQLGEKLNIYEEPEIVGALGAALYGVEEMR